MNGPFAMIPQAINENHWSVKDKSGEEKAWAVRDDVTGTWTAYLNPKLCAESMNFLSCRSDNPASALSNLLAYNIEMARATLEQLQDIDTFMDLRVFDEPEVVDDVMATI